MELFCILGILILYSQNIYSTLMFVVKHKDIFTLNVELHNLNTRHRFDLHVPSVTLTEVQKGAYYSGITLFNALPLSINTLRTRLLNCLNVRSRSLTFRHRAPCI